MDRDDIIAALVDNGWNSATVEEHLNQFLARVWADGAYDFTNGKWGLPAPGENPYGDVTDD